MLATLQLDPARTAFLSQFIDTYLKLAADEEQRFQAEVDRLETAERDAIMQTVTSWEERGRLAGEAKLVLRQLHRKVGQLPSDVEADIQALEIDQVEALGEALLDFSEVSDLKTWLQQVERPEV